MCNVKFFKERVTNMSSIKSNDEKVLIKSAKEVGRIVTIENNNIISMIRCSNC